MSCHSIIGKRTMIPRVQRRGWRCYWFFALKQVPDDAVLPQSKDLELREHDAFGQKKSYGAMRVAFAVPFNSIVVPFVAGGTG